MTGLPPAAAAESLGQVAPSSNRFLPPGLEAETFLQFHLTQQEIALISLNRIAGVVALSLEQILPVPGLGPEIMGAYEWRGQVIWVVDLVMILTGEPLVTRPRQQSSAALVVMEWGRSAPVGGQIQGVGGVVEAVGEMETLTLDQIQPVTPGIFPPPLEAMLRGYLSASGVPVVEVSRILQRLGAGFAFVSASGSSED